MADPILPDAALAQHTAVLGKTGSGKTSTAKLAIEQVVPHGARVCVLDPIKSDWWGLTSSADGSRPGLPFHILGGPRGHVPLHEKAGKAIGEIVATGGLPLSIIDMADFPPGGQAHFFVDFAPVLLRRMRGVLYLVIEEAHLFAPKERSGIGAENLSIHWAKTLATAGRSKGIRLILVTQRTQALHNALLGSCDTLIAHRLTAPADQDPVIKWLKANVTPEVREKVASSLSQLRTGSGWICSGEARIFELRHFRRIATYDNTATPTGDSPDHAVRTAPVDQEKLRAIIGDAIREAETSDPKALRARIAELERQVRANAPAADPEAIERAVKRGYDQGYRDARGDARNLARKIGSDLTAAMARILPDLQNFDPDTETSGRPKPAPNMREAMPAVSPRRSDMQVEPTPMHQSAPKLQRPARTGAELRILKVLAQRHPSRLTEAQWATLAGMKRTGGTWGTYKSRLRVAGYLEEGGGLFGVTAAGLEAAGELPPGPRTPAEIQAMWRQALGGGAARMLDALIEAYPQPLTRTDLAYVLDMVATGGTFGTYLSRLRSNGLIETAIGAPGKIMASGVLFGE